MNKLNVFRKRYPNMDLLYVGVHIRRTDYFTVTGFLVPEVSYISFTRCQDTLGRFNAGHSAKPDLGLADFSVADPLGYTKIWPQLMSKLSKRDSFL